MFADKNALKGSLINILVECRPTFLLSVPRVFEKIYENMIGAEERNGPVKRRILEWAKSFGLKHNNDQLLGKSRNSSAYWLANTMVYSKVRKALGLDRCRYLVSGAAPISKAIKSYLLSLDILLIEAYGMSEVAGAHTINHHLKYNLDSVGFNLSGMKTKLHNTDEDGNGEIYIKGRHVFMGYLNDLEMTVKSKEEDGWFHSGDVGKVENDFLFITGRIKEILITAGGENIPPIRIEELVKKELPQLSNAMLIGDNRKFLTILVALRTDMDSATGAPLDTLAEPVKLWLKSLGCDYSLLSEVIKAGPDPKVLAAIEQGIKRANVHSISNAQKVQKFALLPCDFSIATGELGPTLKIMRRVVTQKYHDVIDAMYK